MLVLSRSLISKTFSVSRQSSKKLARTSNTKSSSLAFRTIQRAYKIEASELKVGDVIDHKNKLLEITKLQHTLAAQSRANMQVELKDIRTGNKGSERFRVTESVEVADLDWKELTFEEAKDDVFVFSDLDDEPFELPKSFFPGKEAWLRKGIEVQVRVLEEEPLYFRFTKRYQILQVAQTKDNVEQLTPRGKPATLSNGVIVKVPPFLQTGAWVKIDVVTEEYVGKEDRAPVEDEDD